MLAIKPVRDRNKHLIPPVIARFVGADEQKRAAPGVKT
jgi:hypothetical protein